MNGRVLLVLALLGVRLFLMRRYVLPPRGKKYEKYFLQAARQYSIPAGLLERVAKQESNFLPEIISGKVKSRAGAVGLMQIVPKWHPNVDPKNPVDSIFYAAKFLKELHNEFGSWRFALGAYNWGSGNMRKWLRNPNANRMPEETRNYINEISIDTGVV